MMSSLAKKCTEELQKNDMKKSEWVCKGISEKLPEKVRGISKKKKKNAGCNSKNNDMIQDSLDSRFRLDDCRCLLKSSASNLINCVDKLFIFANVSVRLSDHIQGSTKINKSHNFCTILKPSGWKGSSCLVYFRRFVPVLANL